MATATAKPGQAARAANRATASKPAARSGTALEMPDARAVERFCERMSDVLRPNQLRILWRLSGGEPVTAAELATALDRTPNTINNHLKTLRTRGLIEATGEPRTRIYALTGEGRGFVDWVQSGFKAGAAG